MKVRDEKKKNESHFMLINLNAHGLFKTIIF